MAQLQNTTINDTGNLKLPTGTTAQRPGVSDGKMRFNSNTGKVEFYNSAAGEWLGSSLTGVSAAGGNSVYDIDVEGTKYRVHVFRSPGNSTFTVKTGGEVEYLIVAGGGGGGGSPHGAGGGAGGLLTGTTTVTPQSYTITVGASGAGYQGNFTSPWPSAGTNRGGQGGNSSALGLTSIGGGGGGGYSNGGSNDTVGGNGGSGGGTGRDPSAVGAGTAGQGFGGGRGGYSFIGGGGYNTAGGGGGAGGRGYLRDAMVTSHQGHGGPGISSNISGNTVFYAGGGGGSSYAANAGEENPPGGIGGGGIGDDDASAGIVYTSAQRRSTPGTGGGGGGAERDSSGDARGGDGGSGIVILRYPLQQENPVTAPGKIIGDGLVLDLDFAKSNVYQGSGSQIRDSRLNGYTGTLSNGTTGINTRTHRAGLFFDGSNDRLDTSLTQSFNDVLTVECWYRGTKSARNHLWNFTGNNLHCNFNDGTYPLWMYWNGSGGNRVRYNGNFTDGTIKHLVFTHSGSTNKVYLNGVELTIAESGGTQTFSNIGGTGFNVGDVAFGGDIYVLKVYEKALSSAEVLQSFNATRWRFEV